MQIFFKRNSRVLVVASSCYVVGLLLGIIFSNVLPVDQPVTSENPTIMEFFIHNLVADLLISFTIFTFGIFTMVLLVMNGFLVGLSAVHSLELGNSMPYVLVALLPHGVFEIPSMIVAGAIGFKLLDTVMMKLKGKSKIYLIQDISIFLVMIVCFTLIAAVIEATVTPFLLTLL
ncbi:stage II sporulation protein M [Bacillus sp. J37]|uniref:stage II sporulation protein M n=1 Tax=Bacillus sp. J37 TaxID=935837 RepID=UPI00047E85A7|nr:stage II sporulation protein M [Bacillus sp. J37]